MLADSSWAMILAITARSAVRYFLARALSSSRVAEEKSSTMERAQSRR